MIQSFCAALFLSILLSGTNVISANAAIIAIDSFRDFRGGSFIDLPSHNSLDALSTHLDVTIVAGRINGTFAGGIKGTVSDPGDGAGLMVKNPSLDSECAPIVLDFDRAIQGFGVSFYHMESEEYSWPAKLALYQLPGAKGRSIATLTDSGIRYDVYGEAVHQDFVGVVGDKPLIRSVLLSGSGPQLGFAVDGVAVLLHSPAPVPLPAGFFLLGSSLIVIGALRLFGRI